MRELLVVKLRCPCKTTCSWWLWLWVCQSPWRCQTLLLLQRQGLGQAWWQHVAEWVNR
jgi:hypothetical protein